MNHQIDVLFKLGMHEVGCLDELLLSGGSNANKDHNLSDDAYVYLRSYKKQGREISVRAVERGDGMTEVLLLERSYHLLPKSRSKLVISSPLKKGNPFLKFGWKPWVQDRVIAIEVASAYDKEELVDVAERATEKLREEYFMRYKAEMKYAPLEDMVLTNLIRQ